MFASANTPPLGDGQTRRITMTVLIEKYFINNKAARLSI